MRLDKNGGVLADTWYIDSKLVGEGVKITLPNLEWLTQSIKANGNMDIPLAGLTDALDCNITTDGGIIPAAVKPGMQSHECRWVKTVIDKNGSTKEVGCKAFLKMISKNIPEQAVEEQEAMESSYDYSVSRYQLFENGVEKVLIDKIAGVFKINGTNYAKSLDNYLY